MGFMKDYKIEQDASEELTSGNSLVALRLPKKSVITRKHNLAVTINLPKKHMIFLPEEEQKSILRSLFESMTEDFTGTVVESDYHFEKCISGVIHLHGLFIVLCIYNEPMTVCHFVDEFYYKLKTYKVYRRIRRSFDWDKWNVVLNRYNDPAIFVKVLSEKEMDHWRLYMNKAPV